MDQDAAREDLLGWLQRGRDAVVWKLEGLGEEDIRRPLVPTGTNLLGLVKHLCAVELGYFSVTLQRPFEDMPDWVLGRDDPNADLYATPEESRESLVALYRRVWAHTNRAVTELPLDATATVPWWPPAVAQVTIHRLLVHVATETHRHAGHADIVRELIDGSAGLTADRSNLPDRDAQWWQVHYQRVADAARAAATRGDGSDTQG